MSNTSSRVILPEAFRARLSADHLKQLEEHGVKLDPIERLADYALKPLQPGEIAVGTLTEDEVSLFIAWKEALAAQRALARTLEVRQYRANADLVERMAGEESHVEAPNVTTAADIARTVELMEIAGTYRDLLALNVRMRLDLWHYTVAYRSEGRIARGPRRTPTGCDE